MQDERWIIIGLGNEFVCDDGVGIHAVRELRKLIVDDDPASYSHRDNIIRNAVLRESTAGGLELLDYIIGYRNCILMDAVLTGNNPPGTIYRHLYRRQDEPVRIASSHQMNIPDLLGLAKLFHSDVPSNILIYGMEVEDVTTFSTCCTPGVQRMLQYFVEAVTQELSADLIPVVSGEYKILEFPRWCFDQTGHTGSYQIFES